MRESEVIRDGAKREAARTGKSLEQIALDWIAQHIQQPQRGSAATLLPFFGAWSMTSEERARIELWATAQRGDI